MTRLFQRIAKNELALGAAIRSGPQWIISMGKAGFDYVRPDMMFSTIDWNILDHMLRIAENAGVTTVLRIPSNPWLGGVGQMQVTVEAARAFSIGVPVVQCSVASAAQVEALIEVSKDWHRTGTNDHPTTKESFEQQQIRVMSENLLIPSIESATALEEIEEIVALPGLQAIMIAATDFSKIMGYPLEYDHPEVWKQVDRIIALAKAKGLLVATNTGYPFNTPELINERVTKLHQHGVQMVMIQSAEFLLENLSKPVLAATRAANPPN